MPFESLSETYEFLITDYPAEWLPLTYLYDPDLPLFPILYFHALDPRLSSTARPGFQDRVFGYIQFVNLQEAGAVAGIVLNKNLNSKSNSHFKPLVEKLVRERLGLGSPIQINHIAGALKNDLCVAQSVMEELWHKVVDAAFGKMLPFGRIWDPVFGLVRFIASWNSDGGRKGELIQTHYFAQAFGQRIAFGSGINIDFYLLPTLEELQDQRNPLTLFPRFSILTNAAKDFVSKYCSQISIDEHSFSAFRRKDAGIGSKLDTANVLKIVNRESGEKRHALFEAYNAFNRGPHRLIIGLLMLHDLKMRSWDPEKLTPLACAKMYTDLQGSHQTPKVLQLYAQQCFGSEAALPIDNWVKTFLVWPLGFQFRGKKSYISLFNASDSWGKLERLIWVSAQARKVHSSVCADILWCIRYGGPDKQMRGANPLSCKICHSSIRSVCPAFQRIKSMDIHFNEPGTSESFSIATSAGNATSPNQTFDHVTGGGIYDEYSSRDQPNSFRPFPQARREVTAITVSEFIDEY